MLYVRVPFLNWNRLGLDDLELGSEIVKVEQNMILGPHVKQKREGSDDSAMTID